MNYLDWRIISCLIRYNVVFYGQRIKHPTEIYLRQMSIYLCWLRLMHRKICDSVLLTVWNYLWEQRLKAFWVALSINMFGLKGYDSKFLTTSTSLTTWKSSTYFLESVVLLFDGMKVWKDLTKGRQKEVIYPKDSSIATQGDHQVHFAVEVWNFIFCIKRYHMKRSLNNCIWEWHKTLFANNFSGLTWLIM